MAMLTCVRFKLQRSTFRPPAIFFGILIDIDIRGSLVPSTGQVLFLPDRGRDLGNQTPNQTQVVGHPQHVATFLTPTVMQVWIACHLDSWMIVLPCEGWANPPFLHRVAVCASFGHINIVNYSGWHVKGCVLQDRQRHIISISGLLVDYVEVLPPPPII
ncbi:hypothetical protein BDZ97DRAFT_1765121 [Flammula alnicola]|nr:hypothetical protein BDZ97DRAFT_1765121 [Flammula alnicola]